MNTKYLHTFSLVLALTLFTSCSPEYIQTLTTAENHFEEATEMDNERLFDDEASSSSQIETSYLTAHELVSTLIAEEKEALTKSDLMGRAYRLKALSEWRLKKWEDALATKDEANSSNISFQPADKTLMEALPSLVNLDRANQFMFEKTETYNSVESLLKESIMQLNQSTGANPAMNNTRLYLLTHQLSAMHTWSTLITFPQDHVTDMPSENVDTREKEWCEDAFKNIWKNFETEVARVNSAAACKAREEAINALSPTACEGLELDPNVCSN